MVPQQARPPEQSGPVPPQLQDPLTQLSPESQTTAQPPQLVSSVLVSTQEVPQQVNPPLQLGPLPPQRQAPDTQLSPESQGWLQPPQ